LEAANEYPGKISDRIGSQFFKIDELIDIAAVVHFQVDNLVKRFAKLGNAGSGLNVLAQQQLLPVSVSVKIFGQITGFQKFSGSTVEKIIVNPAFSFIVKKQIEYHFVFAKSLFRKSSSLFSAIPFIVI
jgi:hypothetical protein